MKLYDIRLRISRPDQYIYTVEDRRIVSPDKLMFTISEMLNRYPDEKASVEITHIEVVL